MPDSTRRRLEGAVARQLQRLVGQRAPECPLVLLLADDVGAQRNALIANGHRWAYDEVGYLI